MQWNKETYEKALLETAQSVEERFNKAMFETMQVPATSREIVLIYALVGVAMGVAISASAKTPEEYAAIQELLAEQ